MIYHMDVFVLVLSSLVLPSRMLANRPDLVLISGCSVAELYGRVSIVTRFDDGNGVIVGGDD